MGEVVLRDPDGDWLFYMSRPDPPDGDTVVRTSSEGQRITYVFAGYENETPVYVREDDRALSVD